MEYKPCRFCSNWKCTSPRDFLHQAQSRVGVSAPKTADLVGDQLRRLAAERREPMPKPIYA